jgi:hypothetical protein
MGLTSTSFIVSIQTTVSWHQRGIATAANMFMRNLGNTIGAALLGGILNNRIMHYFREHGHNTGNDLSIDSTNILLNEEERNKLASGTKALIQDGLTFSLQSVYYTVLIFAVISFLLVVLLPKKDPDSAE